MSESPHTHKVRSNQPLLELCVCAYIVGQFVVRAIPTFIFMASLVQLSVSNEAIIL
jgi:hypothetical protein